MFSPCRTAAEQLVILSTYFDCVKLQYYGGVKQWRMEKLNQSISACTASDLPTDPIPHYTYTKKCLHKPKLKFFLVNSAVDRRPRTENFTLNVCQIFDLHNLTSSLMVLCSGIFIAAISIPIIDITLYRGMGSVGSLNWCPPSVFNLIYRIYVLFINSLWFKNQLSITIPAYFYLLKVI